jgi:hypothetical protein
MNRRSTARHPQGLKPASLSGLGGATEVLPFPKPSMRSLLGSAHVPGRPCLQFPKLDGALSDLSCRKSTRTSIPS